MDICRRRARAFAVGQFSHDAAYCRSIAHFGQSRFLECAESGVSLELASHHYPESQIHPDGAKEFYLTFFRQSNSRQRKLKSRCTGEFVGGITLALRIPKNTEN
jgi:hypothetical protein